MKKIISLLLKLFLTLTILFYIINKINIKILINSISNVNPKILCIAFGLSIFSSFILSIRWNIFLKKYKKLKIIDLFKVYWASDFVNLFGLASVGGEAYKTVVFKNDKKKVLFSSLLSRIYSLFGFAIIAISATISYFLFVSFIQRALLTIFLFSLITSLFIFFDLKLKSMIKKIVKNKRITSIIEESKLDKKQLWSSSLLNILFVFNLSIVYALIFSAMGLPNLFFEIFMLVPIMSIAMALPISIQGIGLREFIFLKFAEINNLISEKVIAVSIIIYLFFLVYSLFGSIFFLSLKRKE